LVAPENLQRSWLAGRQAESELGARRAQLRTGWPELRFGQTMNGVMLGSAAADLWRPGWTPVRAGVVSRIVIVFRSQNEAKPERDRESSGDLADMSRTKGTAIEIWDLDGNGIRCAVALDGVIRFVGSHEECKRRAQLLVTASDRDRQDIMLIRAVR
jgi:hypothetical protein